MGYRLMAVFAHPDDESCGPGGTLALYASLGVDVTLVCATRGELGGEPAPDKRADPQLGSLRARELRAACKALGLTRCFLLDLSDGRVVEHASSLQTELVQLIRTFQPQVLLTFDPESPAGGPDHQAVAQAVTRAFWLAGESTCCEESGACGLRPHGALRLYCWLIRPCCGQAVMAPDAAVVTIDVTVFLRQRRAALACHRSQAACCAQAIARLAEPDEAFERFRLGASRLALPPGTDGDLFVGIRKGA